MKAFLNAWKRMLATSQGKKAVLKYLGGTAGLITGLWFLLDGYGEMNVVSVCNKISDVMSPEELEDLGNRLLDSNNASECEEE